MTTSKPQHTPGPWRIVERNAIRSCEAAPRTICMICEMFPHLTEEEERNANARLIAAAPELLSALEQLDRELTVFEMFGESGNTASRANIEKAQLQARLAIAKATGT